MSWLISNPYFIDLTLECRILLTKLLILLKTCCFTVFHLVLLLVLTSSTVVLILDLDLDLITTVCMLEVEHINLVSEHTLHPHPIPSHKQKMKNSMS